MPFDLNNINKDPRQYGGANSIGNTAQSTASTPTYGSGGWNQIAQSVGGGGGGGGGGSWGPTAQANMPAAQYGPVQPPTGTPSTGGTAGTPSPYTAPTIAETLNPAQKLADIQKQALSIQDQLKSGSVTGLTQSWQMPGIDNQSQYDAAFNSGTPLDAKSENAIRRQQLKMYQKEIDATNQIYDQMMREEQMRGQGRVGSTTAIGARAGILGSDFSNTQQETIKDYNTQITNGISAERAAKIAGIMGEARKSAADEIAAKNLARKQGADALIEHYKSTADRKTQNVTKIAGALVSQGIDPSTLDDKTMKDMAKQAGTTPEDIMYAYQSSKAAQDKANAATALETQKTQSEIDKNNRITVGEGEAYIDATGKVLYKNPKTFAPTSGGSGSGGAPGAYGSDLDAVIGSATLMIPSKFGQENFQRQLSSARNDADRLNLVAGVVLKSQSADMRNDFTNLKTGVSQLDKAIKMLDTGTKTGYLENGAQYAFNAFGKDYDPKLTELRQNVIAAVQPYRNSVTGAAWGAQEESEYQALFGSNKYAPAELRSRLETMKGILINKQASVLNSFVNPMDYYQNPYSPQDTTSTGPATDSVDLSGYSDEELQALANGG